MPLNVSITLRRLLQCTAHPLISPNFPSTDTPVVKIVEYERTFIQINISICLRSPPLYVTSLMILEWRLIFFLSVLSSFPIFSIPAIVLVDAARLDKREREIWLKLSHLKTHQVRQKYEFTVGLVFCFMKFLLICLCLQYFVQVR